MYVDVSGDAGVYRKDYEKNKRNTRDYILAGIITSVDNWYRINEEVKKIGKS